MRKAITSIYLIVNKQEFPSRHKLLPDFYCHFPIVVVVTISIIFRCCSCCCSKLNSWFTRLVASNNIHVHFFPSVVYFDNDMCQCAGVVIFHSSAFHFVLQAVFFLFIRLPLLLASVFIFVNGVVMICDGVKNKFPWTTILFSICAFFLCSLLHPPYLAALSEIQFSTRMIAYRACDKHMCGGVENIQC